MVQTATVSSETAPSVQEEIFKTLLRTPHRLVDEVLYIHKEQMERDPHLYGHLATHAVYKGNCAVRDIQDCFVATLFISSFSEHREAAWVMLQDLPPFRVVRVINYIRGFTEIVKHTSRDAPMPVNGRFGLSYSSAHYSPRHADVEKRGETIPTVVRMVGKKLRKLLRISDQELVINTYRVRHLCHDRPLNRFVRSAVKNYLQFREREDNRHIMEGAILRARNEIKKLYAACHILPGGSESHWVNRVLFHGEVPKGSRLEAMKNFIVEEDPTKQAQIIMDAKLPYSVVKSLVKTITPAVLVSLIDAMSSQELLANLTTIKRDGAFDNPEIKELVQAKLRKIKKARRGKVDALKGEIAAKAVGDLDEDTQKLITEVTDTQLKQHGEIGVKTAVLVDRSASMEDAIELAKMLGAAIAQACKEGCFAGCYLFGASPIALNWTAADGDITKKSSWDKKLKMIKADGMTDLGACGKLLIRKKVEVDQIVLITDEGENGAVKFSATMEKYKKKFGYIPNIVIFRVWGHRWGASTRVADACRKIGAEVDVMDVKKLDKISIPNAIRLISRKSIFEYMQEILEQPLPTRNEWYAQYWPEKLTG